MKKWQKLLLLWIGALMWALLAPYLGFIIGEVIRGINEPFGHVAAGMLVSVIILISAAAYTVAIIRKP